MLKRENMRVKRQSGMGRRHREDGIDSAPRSSVVKVTFADGRTETRYQSSFRKRKPRARSLRPVKFEKGADMKAMIEAGRTPAGGFTRKQLAAWGVPWPPPQGWRKELESLNP